jgi:hypothetical protein
MNPTFMVVFSFVMPRNYTIVPIRRHPRHFIESQNAMSSRRIPGSHREPSIREATGRPGIEG